jgi:nucleoside-diphosphate-sugar epimerase
MKGKQGGIMPMERTRTASLKPVAFTLTLWCVQGGRGHHGPRIWPLLRYAHLRVEGGCLTGPNHAGVELHGFLSYLIKCNIEGRVYRIYGYKGKQVRDNIDSLDVAQFIQHFIESPRAGEVYNLGGGRQNSVSILEPLIVS